MATLPRSAADGMKPRFHTQREYALGYLVLSLSSKEVDHLADVLRPAITSLGGVGCSYLDIGCGDGRLTSQLSGMFHSITVYEPNPISFSLAQSHLSASRAQLLTHNSVFPIDDTLNNTVETVLASNVLYHVDKSSWTQFFQAIASVLQDGGTCFVALLDDRAETKEFVNRASPNKHIYSARDLIELERPLRALGLELLNIYQISPLIKTHSLDASALVADFFLGNSRHSPSTDMECTVEAQRQMMTVGMSNSQNIFVYRKRL